MKEDRVCFQCGASEKEMKKNYKPCKWDKQYGMTGNHRWIANRDDCIKQEAFEDGRRYGIRVVLGQIGQFIEANHFSEFHTTLEGINVSRRVVDADDLARLIFARIRNLDLADKVDKVNENKV